VSRGGRLSQVSLGDFDWLMSVNFRAVVVMTHTLLPNLLATPGSHLCNVSSLFGLIAPGGQTAYSASKFAVRGFSDALRQELVEDGVGVTTVHPGGIRTRIAEDARIGEGVDQQSTTPTRRCGTACSPRRRRRRQDRGRHRAPQAESPHRPPTPRRARTAHRGTTARCSPSATAS
jgi:short-subunit dehydrogenase